MNPNHARSSTHQAYRPEIDGLRAIAVVAVIINHFSKSTLPSGYLGVDIFFVISGYVITRSLLHKQQAGLGSFLLRFYARRARRLIPALVAFTLISGVLICIVNPAPAASLRTGAAGLIGLSNIELFMQATDYFAPSTEMNIFTHTWSLGVEEQFYLFYPILFWFAARLKGDGGGYVINNLRPSLLIISVASLALFFYWWHHNPPAAYFLTFSRLWELSCGCLLATQRQNSVMTMKPGNSLTAALSLAGIATVMFAPQQFAPITTPAVVLATAALIYYARSADPAIQFLQSKPVVFIGLISYSLYLWHWAILCLSRWTIGIQWWTIPLQSALMFGLAYASYRFIESPIRHASSTGWQHADVVAITSGTLSSVGSAALVLAGLPGLGPVLFRLASPGEAMNPLYISEPYVPKKPWINTKNCTNPTSVSLKDKIDQCSLKASADKPTLFFLGDSQSHHLKGMAGRLQEVHGLGSQLLSISSMPFPTGHFWLSGPSELQRSKQDAERQNKIAATSIERARPKDIIILSARYIAYFSDYKIPLSQRGMDMKKYDSSGKRISDSIALLQWGRQLRSFLDRAAKKDIHVVVIAPFPEFPYSGSRCISYASIVNPQVDCRQAKQGLSSRSQQFQTMMNQIVKQHNNLYLFDPVPHLCPDRDYCYAKDRFGRLLFYDATHLSVYGSSTLATAFFSFLQKNQLIDAAASKDEELTPRQTSGREIIRLDTKPSAARKSG